MSVAARPVMNTAQVQNPILRYSSDAQNIGANCTVTLTFKAGGTIVSTKTAAATWLGDTPPSNRSWYFPNAPSLPFVASDNHWIRATLEAGATPTTGNIGVWTKLDTDQAWSNTQVGVGSRLSDLIFEIARDSLGVDIVASTIYSGSFSQSFALRAQQV